MKAAGGASGSGRVVDNTWRSPQARSTVISIAECHPPIQPISRYPPHTPPPLLTALTPSMLYPLPSALLTPHSSIPSSRKVVWPALFLRPLLIVRLGMLLQNLLVIARQLLPAESTDGHLLLGFDGCSVGVDFDAGACCFGLFVLAVNTVFLGDRHGCYGGGELVDVGGAG